MTEQLNLWKAALEVAFDQTCSVGRPNDWKLIKDALDSVNAALTHPAQPTHITWDASGNRCVNGVPAEGGEAWAKTASELNHFAHTGKWPEDSTAPPASQAQAQQPSEPNCDRSACGDFSPGPCDHPDCHALRKQQPSGGEVDDTIARLMQFYDADNLQSLALAQCKHVERLQAKLPRIDMPVFTRVREG